MSKTVTFSAPIRLQKALCSGGQIVSADVAGLSQEIKDLLLEYENKMEDMELLEQSPNEYSEGDIVTFKVKFK